jgi:thioesterase domain-containing protein
LSIESLEEKNAAAKFDLSLRMKIRETEEDPALEAEFLYNTDLFDDTTIVYFAQCLQCLFKEVVAQPDQSIWQLPFLARPEPEHLTAARNAHQDMTLPEQKIWEYQLVEAQAVLNQYPTTPSGVDSQAPAMPEKLEARSETQAVPHSEIEAKLVGIWENLLQISPIDVHNDFFDLGGNSLMGVRLMAQIQRVFQQELPLSVLLQKTTPEQLATELLRRRWSDTRSALVGIQTRGTKLPFFCVHPIGGEVFCYADLARELGPNRPFYGLQIPERSRQQEVFQTIEETASQYIAEIQKVQMNGPYLLGGWSMGGVIAFEMAQQLLRQHQKVGVLALFDSYVPTVQHYEASVLVQQFGEDLEGVFSKKPVIDYRQMQDLSPEEQLVKVYRYAKLADILPPDLELRSLLAMFSIYKKNVEALRRYQPQAYMNLLTLFSASSLERDRQAERISAWQALAQQEVEVHTLPGDHYSILKKPNLKHLVEQLNYCLDNVGESSPEPVLLLAKQTGGQDRNPDQS